MMAKPSVAARAAPPTPQGPTAFDGDQPELSLRALKNRLQSRFPGVRSSHLTEAIATGLGFKTNAALLAAQRDPLWSLAYHPFQVREFKRRLMELSYPLQADFRFGLPPAAPMPPAKYLEWLRELKQLEKATNRAWGRIHALRQQCANEFARTFGLGNLKDESDKSVVKRWGIGVDHPHCLPGWGKHLNSRQGGNVDFPGSDHRCMFFESLPLSGSVKPKRVEYCNGMVSMPYVGSDGLPCELEEAAHRAGRIGWTCSVLSEWSWYAPGSTALVLFKRSTPAEELRKAWSRSFKRWMLENRTRLTRSAPQLRKNVIEDIISCEHLPLDLKDFADCQERYLKEFASSLYWHRTDAMAQHFENLMMKWVEESSEESLA